MRDQPGLRWLVLAAGLHLHCTSTVESTAPADGGPDRADAAPDVAPDAAPDTAPDASLDAPTPGNTCADARPIGDRWVVPVDADGEALRCELGGTERAYAWSSITVPGRAVLVLRSWDATRGPDQVSLFADCRATTCLPTVQAESEGLIVRRYFNDSTTPRLVRIAARRGAIVLPTIEHTAPNLRCADATIIERAGTYVDDGPFPASDPAPACPEVLNETPGPVRWYRVEMPYLQGNTLRVTAPLGVNMWLVTACGAASCAAAPYQQIYNETLRVLRWPVARGATAPLYLAVGRRPELLLSTAPVPFTVGMDFGIGGRLCNDAIRVNGTLDLSDFETRSGAERIPVCNDTLARTVRARWFDVFVPPGHSLIAHTLEVSSTVRTVWQLYADCDDRRCGIAAPPTPFVTTLEHANTTTELQSFKLALGNLAPAYVDVLRVRVRVFRPSPNGTCATARRLAPNELVLREDLTTGREGPPPCAAGLPRRSLWYVTTVPPGHELAPLLVNRSEPEVRVDLPDTCPAGACTATFANRTAVPIEVTYAVSQEARLGFFATYDLVARTVPLP
ncbi:MAG: hypothetical protein Q8S73_35810 [Deltaproteobacteria bacterium]|nr:hypothetical protein [Myxococcales bacterium]MDP3219523.1 hypothetical protein [Deltaproteobacteria bacterium]